jgi:hypothetical protein
MIDLCNFLGKATQNERKCSIFTTENRYPDTEKCQQKIKMVVPKRERANEK